MKKTIFYMVRHGETEFNLKKLATGWVDTSLTQTGIEQAKECGELIRALDLDLSKIVCSSLTRTRLTSKLINQYLDLQIVENAKLNEQFFGDWEGKPWHSIFQQIRVVGVNPPNGELQKDFILRINNTLLHYLMISAKPILFVLHGGVFEALGLFYGIRLQNIQNGALYEFQIAPTLTRFPWQVILHRFQDDKVASETVALEEIDNEINEDVTKQYTP